MRIKNISVTGLFGIFNHTIPLNLGNRITIVFGPNGFGKTFVLTLVNALFKGTYGDFFRVPFETLTLDFEDESRITAEKNDTDKKSFLLINYKKPDGVSRNLKVIKDKEKKNNFDFLDIDAVESGADAYSKEEPSWFVTIRTSLHIIFINTERLIRMSDASRRGENVQAVTEYRIQLRQDMEKKLAEYATVSQSLDRTFPLRLAGDESGKLESTENLVRRIGEIEKKREELVDTGLLDRVDINTAELIHLLDKKRDVLEIYIEDTEKKLSVLDDLADRIKILVRIVNQRFLNKKIEISRTEGFIFRMSNGSVLMPENLSSGEQHIVVLLYEMLFRINRDALIFIDEPELSLHIFWQQQFVKDLLDIIGLIGFDAVIATHSPQIIHDRWDLAVELKADCR